jgi:hypothetical protein
MGPIDFLVHLASFLAPAACLAVVLPPAARLLLRKGSSPQPFWLQALLVFGAGAAVLVAGLWGFGRDGRMATYAGLVLACGTTQWLLLRAWR